MEKVRVIATDGLAPEGVEVFERYKDFISIDVRKGTTKEELLELIGDYDALIVRSATKVTKEVIDKGKRLKIIGRAGIGLDNIDVQYATKKGIIVMNTPLGNTITTAEHAIALMFALARKISLADRLMKEEKWEKKKLEGVELFNKTLGIIGLGNIGSVVAERAIGLKMNVIAYDPYIPEERAKKLGVKMVSFDELLRTSDFISIHVPLTEETKNLINKSAIEKMKPSAMIIHCARGGIVNEEDLYEALVQKRIAGAAIDVWEKEPPSDWKLAKLENVVATPHLGASTVEAQRNVSIDIASQIVDYFVKGIVRNAFNLPSISEEVYEVISPYMELTEKLGLLASQIFAGPIHTVEITYEGEVARLSTEYLTKSFLKGFLLRSVGENLNLINSTFIAKERGINVYERKTDVCSDYVSLVTIKVKLDSKEGIVAGAVFGKKHPRIVRIDDFHLEAIPEGTIIILRNWDRPGVIGNIGTILGKNGINIAHMHIGRMSPGGQAIALVHIDTPAPKEVLEELSKLPNIISVVQVKL